MAIDPVCGQVVVEDNEMSAVYSDELFYFCSLDCKSEFEDDPERFVGWGGTSRFGSA
ncbi:MAG: YHS domain-containing protein [bacterium]|jgi:YHS domain-containing protein